MNWLIENIGAELIAGALVAIALVVWRQMVRASRGLRRPLLIFVSTGGTCRDPMAKIIAERLFTEGRHRIDVEAVGVGDITTDHASKPAQHTMAQMYGGAPLASHRPRKLTKDMTERATLILGMTHAHVDTIRKLYPAAAAKTHAIKAFFGIEGDVDDPYKAPDEMTTEALARYRACAEELRDLLTRNKDHLVAALT